MRRRVAWGVVWTVLLIGLGVGPAAAIDPVLQQAQQKLSQLGYDPGTADGIYGPRTRQALEAFQRAQRLPVSGVLDSVTLQALDRAVSPPPEAPPSETSTSDVPLRLVADYLRWYAYQPARVLPLVSERFRHGVPPAEWIEQTLRRLAEQEFVALGWQVQELEMAATEATVAVQTQVQIQGLTRTRREVFTVRRQPDGAWLIDDHRLMPAAEVERRRDTDS